MPIAYQPGRAQFNGDHRDLAYFTGTMNERDGQHAVYRFEYYVNVTARVAIRCNHAVNSTASQVVILLT